MAWLAFVSQLATFDPREGVHPPVDPREKGEQRLGASFSLSKGRIELALYSKTEGERVKGTDERWV